MDISGSEETNFQIAAAFPRIPERKVQHFPESGVINIQHNILTYSFLIKEKEIISAFAYSMLNEPGVDGLFYKHLRH